MKKFILIAIGFETPTDEIMADWGKWFESIADKMVDPGHHFGPGIEVTHDGTNQLAMDADAITGITIINVESREEAEKIAKACPIITSMRVYEAMSM